MQRTDRKGTSGSARIAILKGLSASALALTLVGCGNAEKAKDSAESLGTARQAVGTPGVPLIVSFGSAASSTIVVYGSQDSRQFTVAGDAVALAAGDVNKDGADEIAIATTGTGTSGVFIFGEFGFVTPFPSLGSVTSIKRGDALAMGDLDNDGADELGWPTIRLPPWAGRASKSFRARAPLLAISQGARRSFRKTVGSSRVISIRTASTRSSPPITMSRSTPTRR